MQSEVAVGAAPVGPRRRASRHGSGLYPYLMVGPALLVIAIFSLLPTAYGLIVSLYTVQFVALLQFVGLRNYVEIFGDANFWHSFQVSLVFTACSVTLEVVVGMALALLANSRLRLRGVFRVVAMLPWVASYVVVYLIFRWMLDTSDGLINAALYVVGIPKVAWLEGPVIANVSLIVVDAWRGSPYAMILLLAGLQTIPGELYEAAAVDGATGWRTFLGVTLPLMKMPILIVLVLMTIINFNVLVAQLVLTGGGPGHATEPLSLLMYSQAFTYFRMGSAASIATFIFALNLVLSGFYIRLLRTPGGY